MQILRACSSPEVDGKRLAALAEKDPALTAELLRVVNTPFFGFSRKVQSLSHAVSILGQRSLRNVVLCLAVRDAIGRRAIPGLDTALYWEASLRRAVSARLLAMATGSDAEECFTAGLLQDFGLLAMFYLKPELATEWEALSALDPEARLQREQALFGITHTRMIQLLANVWGLPAELAQVLGGHHACDTSSLPASQQRLCRVLAAADWLAAVFTVPDKGRVLQEARRRLGDDFGLDAGRADSLFHALAGEVEEAAGSLGLRISGQPDFDEVMLQANVTLAEENLSYQELTWKLEQTLRERDRLAAALDQELRLAREIQQSLLPAEEAEAFPVAGINVSARELSGDFYDYFRLRDGRIYFNLADVSGKGVNAALLMAKTSSLFHCLGKHIHAPDKLLEVINNELCETAIRGMFVTMIAGLYDPRSRSVRLVNAGNPPAVLVARDGGVRSFEATASPLGIVPGSRFPLAEEIELGDGSLYLFSDGATEGRLEGDEMLGLEGLTQLFAAHRDQTPQARLATIVERFRNGSAKLHDDITILLLEEPAAGA